MLSYLAELKSRQANCSDYVVASQKSKPFAEQYISRLAREALDRVGQKNVRLLDLRHDYVVRQLQEHDWQYVSQVSGIGLVSLRDHFMTHIQAEEIQPPPTPVDTPPAIDQKKIAQLMESERYSPAATLVCLSGRVGLLVGEMQYLTWRQIDFLQAVITLPDRTVPIPVDALTYLTELKTHDGTRSEYVIISKRAGKPLEAAYLSKTARTALVSAGICDVTLSDLRSDFIRRTQVEAPILALAKECGNVTRAEVIKLLDATRTQAYSRLNHMVMAGKLVRVGNRYFLPEQTTPPERHTELILNYLRRDGSAVRQDFARLLNVLPRQVYPILQKLVASGDIVFQDGRYYLSQRG
jgi:integrase